MKKILKYLSSPYPLFYQRWKVALISCGIVFFILLLFQPFGISAISHNKLGILLGYMVVTGLFLCIPVYLLPFLFPDFLFYSCRALVVFRLDIWLGIALGYFL